MIRTTNLAVPSASVIRAALFLEMILFLGCDPQGSTPQLLKFTGTTMGTTYSVIITDGPKEISQRTLDDGIEQILSRIDQRMSTYRQNSEVSRFNALQSMDWFSVSKETLMVVKEALEVSKLTKGAFDTTVGPLVNLWGFGPKSHGDHLPSDEAVKDTRAYVGYQLIQTRDEPPAIRKGRPPVQIDLSAIAKGYAVDQIAEFLESNQIKNYLVEIGGEIRARGSNSKGVAWKVAVEKPISAERAVQKVLKVDHHAIASSGDYRNYFEKDGVRYSHTINPLTGKPITHTLAAVTVLGQSAMRSDALATGFMVLGPQQGFQLAEDQGLAVLFLIKDTEGFVEKPTSSFAQFLAEE